MRLGELFNSIASGGTPSKSNPDFWNGDIPWASVKDLGKEKYIAKTQDYISHQGLDAGSKLADEGDILICTRMGLGKIGIASCPVAFNQDLKSVKLTSGVSLDFFFNTYSTVKIKGTGTTVEGIKQEQLINYVIGLPSGNEQHQIVEKVDELMSLCDQLEQQSLTSLDAHQQLVETLLSMLTDSQNAEELAENWARISQHFDTLFNTEASIEALKQTILQLAVMGKLVPQDPNDEPASELLKRIDQEKAQLVKEGRIKKQKPLPPISDDEKPFELPEGWEWCRLETITELITKGSSPKWQGVSYTDNPNDVLFITSENVGSFKILLDSEKYVEKKFNEIEPRSILTHNDILMNIVGASIGRTAIFNMNRNANINQAVCLIRVINNSMLLSYLLNFFNSDICLSYMFDKQVDNARANLSMGNIAKFVLPIPPLNEQKRIVEHIDNLMSICDKLQSHLQSVQQIQLHLADALTDAALN